MGSVTGGQGQPGDQGPSADGGGGLAHTAGVNLSVLEPLYTLIL